MKCKKTETNKVIKAAVDQWSLVVLAKAWMDMRALVAVAKELF